MRHFYSLVLISALTLLAGCEDELKEWVGVEGEETKLTFELTSDAQFAEQSVQQIQFTPYLVKGANIPNVQVSWQVTTTTEAVELPILSDATEGDNLLLSFRTPDVDVDTNLTMDVTFRYLSKDKYVETVMPFDIVILADPEVVLSGQVKGLADAEVAVQAGEATFQSIADSNGRFILEVEIAEPDTWFTVTASKAGNMMQYASVLGSGEYLIERSSSDKVADINDVAELNLTVLTTARYIQEMQLWAFYQDSQSQSVLNAYRQQINLASWLSYSQVLFAIEQQVALNLPHEMTNTMELLLDSEAVLALVESWQLSQSELWQESKASFLKAYRLGEAHFNLQMPTELFLSDFSELSIPKAGKLSVNESGAVKYQNNESLLQFTDVQQESNLWSGLSQEGDSLITFEFLPLSDGQNVLVAAQHSSGSEEQMLWQINDAEQLVSFSVSELMTAFWWFELPAALADEMESFSPTNIKQAAFNLDGTGDLFSPLDQITSGAIADVSYRWQLSENTLQMAGQTSGQAVSQTPYQMSVYQLPNGYLSRPLLFYGQFDTTTEETFVQAGRMKEVVLATNLEPETGRYQSLSSFGQLSEQFIQLSPDRTGLYYLEGEQVTIHWQRQGVNVEMHQFAQSDCQLDGCPLSFKGTLVPVQRKGDDWLFILSIEMVDGQTSASLMSRWLHARWVPEL